MQVFTVMGYTVTNVDQARSVLIVATLKGEKHVIAQCRAIIEKLQK
jgi:hypothetical protein